MYGTGYGGFFEIAAPTGKAFSGLEFIVASGSGLVDPNDVVWTAYLDGATVGSGTSAVARGSIVGFSSLEGFDTLRFTVAPYRDLPTFGSPAFDTVLAQFTSAVPETSTWTLMILGFGGLGFFTAFRQKRISGFA